MDRNKVLVVVIGLVLVAAQAGLSVAIGKGWLSMAAAVPVQGTLALVLWSWRSWMQTPPLPFDGKGPPDAKN